MRLIGELADEQQARIFTAYLRSQGIAADCESGGKGRAWTLWVVEEDAVPKASELYRSFLQEPNHPRFLEPFQREERHLLIQEPAGEESQERPVRRRWGPPMGRMTLILMAVCTVLLFWGELSSPKVGQVTREELAKEPILNLDLLLSPPYAALLFDFPEPWSTFYTLSQSYTLQQISNPSELSPQAQTQLAQAMELPFFDGFYDWLLEKIEAPSTHPVVGPMFVKIREGQVWRLFSPMLLHGGLLHLFINLLWMVILGNQVEYRLGSWRYLLLVAIGALAGNIAQYLVSGAAFLGISGVVVTLFGFVWMRLIKAPWEGYLLNRPTILFVNIFIFGVSLLQLASFILQVSGKSPLPIGIANTAHITGLIVGLLLGRLNFFAHRVS